MDIRQRLVMAQGVEQFRQTMLQAAKELAYEQNQWRERKFSIHLSDAKEQLVKQKYCSEKIIVCSFFKFCFFRSVLIDGTWAEVLKTMFCDAFLIICPITSTVGEKNAIVELESD